MNAYMQHTFSLHNNTVLLIDLSVGSVQQGDHLEGQSKMIQQHKAIKLYSFVCEYYKPLCCILLSKMYTYKSINPNGLSK